MNAADDRPEMSDAMRKALQDRIARNRRLYRIDPSRFDNIMVDSTATGAGVLTDSIVNELELKEGLANASASPPVPEGIDYAFEKAPIPLLTARIVDGLNIMLGSPDTSPKTPTSGLVIAGWMIPRERQDEVLGDIEERFRRISEDRGARTALLWYWGEIIKLICTRLWFVGTRVWAWDTLRRFIGL